MARAAPSLAAGAARALTEVFSQDLHRHSTCMGSGSSQAASSGHDVASVQIEPGQVLFVSRGRIFLQIIQRRETYPEGRAIIPVDHPKSNCQMLGLEFWPGFHVKTERHGHFPEAPERPDDRFNPDRLQGNCFGVDRFYDDALTNRHVCKES